MSPERSPSRPTDRVRGALHYGLELTLITAIYIGFAKFSLTLASIHPSATPIWPTTGFALAITLLRGYRIAPALILGALIVNATTVGSLATSFGIATGNMLESLVGAYCITVFRRASILSRPRAAWRNSPLSPPCRPPWSAPLLVS